MDPMLEHKPYPLTYTALMGNDFIRWWWFNTRGPCQWRHVSFHSLTVVSSIHTVGYMQQEAVHCSGGWVDGWGGCNWFTTNSADFTTTLNLWTIMDAFYWPILATGRICCLSVQVVYAGLCARGNLVGSYSVPVLSGDNSALNKWHGEGLWFCQDSCVLYVWQNDEWRDVLSRQLAACPLADTENLSCHRPVGTTMYHAAVRRVALSQLPSW